jgi:hypothetical protein
MLLRPRPGRRHRAQTPLVFRPSGDFAEASRWGIIPADAGAPATKEQINDTIVASRCVALRVNGPATTVVARSTKRNITPQIIVRKHGSPPWARPKRRAVVPVSRAHPRGGLMVCSVEPKTGAIPRQRRPGAVCRCAVSLLGAFVSRLLPAVLTSIARVVIVLCGSASGKSSQEHGDDRSVQGAGESPSGYWGSA